MTLFLSLLHLLPLSSITTDWLYRYYANPMAYLTNQQPHLPLSSLNFFSIFNFIPTSIFSLKNYQTNRILDQHLSYSTIGFRPMKTSSDNCFTKMINVLYVLACVCFSSKITDLETIILTNNINICQSSSKVLSFLHRQRYSIKLFFWERLDPAMVEPSKPDVLFSPELWSALYILSSHSIIIKAVIINNRGEIYQSYLLMPIRLIRWKEMMHWATPVPALLN